MKRYHSIFLVVFLLIGVSTAMTGCVFNNSVQGRHEMFIDGMNSYVGTKTINYHEKSGAAAISKKFLANGNIENEYGYATSFVISPDGKGGTFHCHYFFEYQPQSGLIVKFRFEETSKYACRGSGA